jgi:hypothetical protein
MAARVAPGVRIDADQLEPPGLHARLLHQLSPAGVLDGLADVDEPAGQRILTLEGRVPAVVVLGIGMGLSPLASTLVDEGNGGGEGSYPTQIPSAALTCFKPSWCWLKLRPPSTPPSTPY